MVVFAIIGVFSFILGLGLIITALLYKIGLVPKTKHTIKPYLAWKGIALIAIGYVLTEISVLARDNSTSNTNTPIKTNCINTDAYKSGYGEGHMNGQIGGTSDCETWVQSYNYQVGRNILSVSECYCEGYKDGYRSK